MIFISVIGGTIRPQLEGCCKYSSPPFNVPAELLSNRIELSLTKPSLIHLPL